MYKKPWTFEPGVPMIIFWTLKWWLSEQRLSTSVRSLWYHATPCQEGTFTITISRSLIGQLMPIKASNWLIWKTEEPYMPGLATMPVSCHGKASTDGWNYHHPRTGSPIGTCRHLFSSLLIGQLWKIQRSHWSKPRRDLLNPHQHTKMAAWPGLAGFRERDLSDWSENHNHKRKLCNVLSI